MHTLRSRSRFLCVMSGRSGMSARSTTRTFEMGTAPLKAVSLVLFRTLS